MPDELKWQRYFMDAPLRSARVTFYALFSRPPGAMAATRRSPGMVLSFNGSPDIVSLSSGGKLRWKRRLEAPVERLAVEGAGDGLYAALSGGLLYYLNSDGAPLWKYRLETSVTALSASEKGNCACASDQRGKVVCLSTEGKLLFNARLEAPPTYLRISQDGSTLVAADGSNATLVSNEGMVLWRKAFADGISDIATTVSCTKTVVLSKTVRSLSLDGSERWSAPVPDGTAAVRMSDDGESIYALGPEVVVRLNPAGKHLWTGDLRSSPAASSVMAGTKMLVLPSAEGTSVIDRWGNLALECPSPLPSSGGPCFSLFDGERAFFHVREMDGAAHVVVQDAGPSLVDYLLRAAGAFGQECARLNQPSPFGEKHFKDAMAAAAAGDFGRALENARFSYRYYEETLSATQRPTEGIVTPDTLGAVAISARADLERHLTERRPVMQAQCACGAKTSVFSNEAPLMVRCSKCGKLGLVRGAPAGN
jgi:outer membrane protein assembly factor BamB